MHAAVRGNSIAVVTLLREKGMALDDSLFFTARNGEIMAYLVAQKLNINVKDAAGSTPLHHAVFRFQRHRHRKPAGQRRRCPCAECAGANAVAGA